MDPHRFNSVLSPDDYQALLALIDYGVPALHGRVIWNVNSTAKGGGVVEMLRPLLGYCRGVGVDARWVVISGNPVFFEITKRLHNHLHGFDGDGGALGRDEVAAYEKTLAADAAEFAPLIRPQDVVILHDPQTAGMAEVVRQTGAALIWRCHVGLDRPNDRARKAWDFLRDYVMQADACVFSRVAYEWEGLRPERTTVIQPSIDAFSPKNGYQAPEQTLAILARSGIIAHSSVTADHLHGKATFERSDGTPGRVDRRADMLEDAPLSPEDKVIVQVSRWDRLKDPLGVLRGFADHVADHVPAHLLLAGPSTASVADDPEGAGVSASVRGAWHELPANIRSRVHLASLPMDDVEENAAIVNALQRHADVVVQKSLAEGFGLTVAEAMWKERPVVASRIGGIQDQIVDGESGVLISDPRDLEEFGAAIVGVLEDSDRRDAIGAEARSRVQHHFLGPQHLGRYFELIQRLLDGDQPSDATPAVPTAATTAS
jgi:trehalose synthase